MNRKTQARRRERERLRKLYQNWIHKKGQNSEERKSRTVSRAELSTIDRCDVKYAPAGAMGFLSSSTAGQLRGPTDTNATDDRKNRKPAAIMESGSSNQFHRRQNCSDIELCQSGKRQLRDSPADGDNLENMRLDMITPGRMSHE